MSFITSVAVFLMVAYGTSTVASRRVETPGWDHAQHRAPGAHLVGRSTRNSPGETPVALVESEPGDIRGYDHRSRRAAFIVDGTRWCGLGDTADSYEDLGEHRGTDICCRDHDHCPDRISGFSWRYGLFNFLPYTINLCSCDESFRLCLLAASTSVSTEVGELFFDTLRPPCIRFTGETGERCVRRGWFGICLEYGETERKAEAATNRPFDGVEYRD